ncbi:Sodium-coupled monocarboxylate transporter 1 [Schistosoma japonicum]|nr:Sodium-coupled monocarboxylate transporter 1 [Schistosoma japonicum]
MRPLHIHWKGVDISERGKYRLALFLGLLFGISTVALAFIFSLSSSHILKISFSLFGAIGGPILTGGLCALISSFVFGLWLCIGAAFTNSGKTCDRLSLTISECSSTILQNISSPATTVFNAAINTAINTNTNISETKWSIYSLSYLYYSTACLIVGIPIGLIISAITGFNSRSPVNPRLLAWQVRAFYRHFPNWFPPQTGNDQEIHLFPSTCSHTTEINNALTIVDIKLPRLQTSNKEMFSFGDDDKLNNLHSCQKNQSS